MGKFDRFCQSCGMPLGQDPGQGGVNADGSKSNMYCSYCWVDGKFVDNFHTPQEMQHFVREKLRDMGINRLLRWLYTAHIPQLERWKQAKSPV